MKEPLALIACAIVVFTFCVLPDRVSCHGGSHDENEQLTDLSECPLGWGCLTSDSCCTANTPNCDVGVQWRAQQGAIRFRLRARTKGYVAVGLSTSGRMPDSEIYSCNPSEVLRGWTVDHSLQHKDIVSDSLSGMAVKSVDGYISCEFLRVNTVPNADSDFQDLSPGNNYTVLAAWADDTDNGYPVYHDVNKCLSEKPVDFTSEGIYVAAMDSEFLPKLHGVLMTVAWLGFAALGITSARYYKPIWPESTLWGKPVWFTIHRTCMTSAFICFLIAALVIVIHIRGYLTPSDGPVRFLHALFGTIAIVLGVCNWIMALFRPHPGTPNRPIYNWAHWGVGSTGFYLALATILLGLADFEGISPLLGGIPQGVFWVAVCFILFHIAIWMSLQYISIAVESTGRDNDVPLVNDDDELEKSPINGNVSTSTGARMKQLLFYVYISGVIIAVLVVVIGVIIAKD